MGRLINAASVAVTVLLAGQCPAGQTRADLTENRGVVELIGSAERWSGAEMARVASALEAPVYFYVPSVQGRLTVDHAQALMRLGKGYGETVVSGAALEPGAYLNISDEPAIVRVGEGNAVIEVPARAIIITGDLIRDAPGIRLLGNEGNTVGVTCGEGYYACCQLNQGGSTVKAFCVANGTSAQCTAGGPGATACVIGIE